MVKRRVASTERKMAKAEEQGRLKAQIENEAKTFKNKKHFMVWIKKLIEKNFDKIPKFVTIIGTTYLIKQLIELNEELMAKVFNIAAKTAEKGWGWFFLRGGLGGLLLFPPGTAEATEEFRKAMDVPSVELIEWLISFSLAYIIVEHAGQIALGLGEAVSGLSGIVGFLLG